MKDLIDLLERIKENRTTLELVGRDLENYIRKNTIISNSKSKFDMYKYTTKDKMRPAMTGVFFCEGYKVATTAQILVYKKEEYSSELEGKIVNKKGEIVDAVFPRWKSVIPTKISEDYEIELDFKAIDAAIKESKLNKKVNKLNKEDCLISLNKVLFKTYMFELFIQAVKEIKTDKVYLKNYNQYASEMIFAEGENGGVLLMAVKRNIDETGADAEALKEKDIVAVRS